MDSVTQRNAAMVEQTTAASHSLSSEADALVTLVSQFRTGAAATASHPKPPPAPIRKPAPAARAKPGKFVAVPRTPVAVANGKQDWDEF